MRLILTFLYFIPFLLFSQSTEEKIKKLEQEIESSNNKSNQLLDELNNYKLQKIREDLAKIGIPEISFNEEIIYHSAMCLVYKEQYEQAKWVAHIILPDIINGTESRSNNFRADTLIKTGSTNDADFFLKTKQFNGKYTYDGYGYDRGHLAPSADFKWSKKALSESYYYSNMSPQAPDFNRGKWADLEGMFREYVVNHPNVQLYMVTGPVLYDTLPKVERSPNKVTIPEFYYKVGLDLTNNKAIGFIMPNKKIEYPISSYAVSISDVEKVTGINFYYQLNDSLEVYLENQKNVTDWLPEKQKNDVTPVPQPTLPPGTFNTVVAKNYMNSGKTISVQGTVVNARKTKGGHLFFNLDKSYPNQLFTVVIWSKDITNFSYDPLNELEGNEIIVKGKVTDFDGIPTMIIEKENVLEVHQNGKMIMIIQ